ncbi:MAG: polymerase, sigma-24 subunit, subfamily [Pedosphaera sp.]|nr:polymerase, sigma-24 subunit, subfamily [Pedosphaera sp.]
MTADDLDLLGQFAREQSQDAFTALVNRHLNLVYSAALRQVRSAHLAEEVSQAVFTNLAQNAAKLSPDTILTAWLYQVTRHTAIGVVRSEARRQAREQIAFQMSEMSDTPADWTHIEPLLDEAMATLDDPDRAAILLRYFENKSLREVGEALGSSEDAAQKRVSRAVERLREFFSKHKIPVGASGLVALASANAIQAAPVGLATTVATGAVLAAAATIPAATAITISKTIVIAMTTTQKIVITAVVAGAIVAGVYQAQQISKLRGQVQASKQSDEQQAALSNQLQELRRERDQAKSQATALVSENAAMKKGPSEVLKLRGEVGRLRQEKAEMGSSSALSKITANPEATKMLRDQQKMGMTMLYKGFAKNAKLTTDQAEKLNDLLADHIMDNVGHVTAVLRDKPSVEQMDKIFADQEAVLQEKVQALLGAEGSGQYQEYTKNLVAALTAEQFKGMLSGEDTAKADKVKQISQAMQEEMRAALARAGLPADYQMMPILNFRNIASEQEADRSLKLLEEVYTKVAARGSSFLSAEELTKFEEFKKAALQGNQAALTMNRTMMAPISN